MDKQVVFLLATTALGPLILSRLDWAQSEADPSGGGTYGVGAQLLATGNYAEKEIPMALHLLHLRREFHGDGVVAIDCGANIGCHTIAWANLMHGWGEVIAIEAQERVFYALCGNIALHNCFNARAILGAVCDGRTPVPVPIVDYQKPASLGSLELLGTNADLGQVPTDVHYIDALTLDDLDLDRVDFIKLDIEGMELEALEGAKLIIAQQRPILFMEYAKAGKDKLEQWLHARRYDTFDMQGGNLLAVHQDDPVRSRVR